MLVAVALFLLRTRLGKAIRAVSDNPDLASATGINTDRVILLVWVVGGALAGLGGILLGLDAAGARGTWASACCCSCSPPSRSAGSATRSAPWSAALVIGLAVELWTWVFPSVDRAEERRRAGRADPGPAGPAPGPARQEGARRDELVLIFSNALYAAISVNAIGYTLIAAGLNVHFGYTGLLNFGQAGFAAVGAYARRHPGQPLRLVVLGAIPLVFVGGIVLGAAARHPDAAPARRLPRHRHDRRRGDRPHLRSNSVRFTWLTGGNDGLQKFTGRRRVAQPVRAAPLQVLGRRPSTSTTCSSSSVGWILVAIASLRRLPADAQPVGPGAQEHPRGRGRRPQPGQERLRLQDAEPRRSAASSARSAAW